MAEFDNYPRYQLDKYGNEIKLILKNAAEFYGMQVSDDTSDIIRGVEYASHPSMKNTIGGAEHLRKGTDADGAKVLFDDQFSTESDANRNTVVYYEHVSATDESVRTKTPLAIGDFTTINQIKQMFETVNGDTSDLPALPTPITLFSDDLIYSYKDIRTETTQEQTLNNIFRVDDGIKFKIKTNSYKNSEYSDIECETSEFYTNKVSVNFLQSQLPSSVPGTQIINTVHLGDDFTYANSAESNYVYRATLGIPVATLKDAAYTPNVKLVDLALPVAEHGEYGLYPEEIGIVSFDEAGNIKQDYRSISYQHYHYKYATGELFNIQGENSLDAISLRKGDFIKAQINFDAENWLTELNNTGYTGPFKNAADVIIVDSAPSELIITNFEKYPKPAAVIFNPENSLVYCFHATSITGNVTVPKKLSFVYKIERPELDKDGNTVWFTVSQGVTDSKIDYNNLDIPVLPAAFFLRKGDKLTLKSRAQYYDDSEEYVFELTDEVLETPAPSGIFYHWNLTGTLTDGSQGYYSDENKENNLIPSEYLALNNPLVPSSVIYPPSDGEPTLPDLMNVFVSLDDLTKEDGYFRLTEKDIWGTLFAPDALIKFKDDQGYDLYLTQPIQNTEDEKLLWGDTIKDSSEESGQFSFIKEDGTFYVATDYFQRNDAINNNLGLVANRDESKAIYLQFVADLFKEEINLGNGIVYSPKTYTDFDVYEPYYRDISDDEVKAMLRKYSLVMSDEKDIQTGIYYSVLEKMIKEYDTRKLLLKVFPMKDGDTVDNHLRNLLTDILNEKANKVIIYDTFDINDKYNGQVTVNTDHIITTLSYNGATYALTKKNTVPDIPTPTTIDYLTGLYTATHADSNVKFDVSVTPGIANTGTITFIVPNLKYPLVEWLYTYDEATNTMSLHIKKDITLKDWSFVEIDTEHVFKTLTYEGKTYSLVKKETDTEFTEIYEAFLDKATVASFDVSITDTTISFPIDTKVISWEYKVLDAIYEEPDINTTTKEDICWLIKKYSKLYYFNPSTDTEDFGMNQKKLTLVDKMLENKRVCDFIEAVFADASDFTSRDAKSIVKEILFTPSTTIPPSIKR